MNSIIHNFLNQDIDIAIVDYISKRFVLFPKLLCERILEEVLDQFRKFCVF